MNRLGVGAAYRNAFSVLANNFVIALVIALIAGGLRDVVVTALASAFNDATHFSGRTQLFATQLAQLGLFTVWGCIVGAWAAPAQIYLWVQREKGQPVTLYDTVNYGLNRFSRVLGPHAWAFGWIQVGSIIIVPQILLGIQYAFVDAIATLDRVEPDVPGRSRRLTANRRRTIFMSFLPMIVWWLPYQLVGFYLGWNASPLYSFGLGTMDHLVLIFLDLVMVQYYLDIFRNRSDQPAPTAVQLSASGAPATTSGD